MSIGMIMAIIVGLGIVSAYYIFQVWLPKKKKTASSQDTSTIELPETIACRVADNITGRVYNASITKEQAAGIVEKHGTLGRQWDRDGEKLYGLNKYSEEGVEWLRPIIIPPNVRHSPVELFGDTQQPEIGIIMTELLKDEEKSLVEQYGKIFMWLAAIGVLLFIWSQSG